MRSLLSALVLALLGLAADVSTTSAQEPGRVYRIGWLSLGAPGLELPPFEKWMGNNGAFRDSLRDRGYAVGKNLVVDVRHAQGDPSRYPAMAEALVATQPDVLVTSGGAAPLVAAMRATRTTPIVFHFSADVVDRGIFKSLVNHGGNATGMTSQQNYLKVWQLLRDAAPAVRRLGFVAYAPNAWAHNRTPEFRAERMAKLGSDARKAGLELVDLVVDDFGELEPKVDALAKVGEAALFLSNDPVVSSWRAKIMEMAIHHRLPTGCTGVEWSAAGCLIAYDQDWYEISRHAGAQVAEILNGAKPADIPIGQPTKFKLIINARTAKALDLTMPLSLLALADEVIE